MLDCMYDYNMISNMFDGVYVLNSGVYMYIKTKVSNSDMTLDC